jgi:hypothetical protein
MRFPLGVGLCCLLAVGAFGQRRGGGGRVGFTQGVRASGRIGFTSRFGNFGRHGFRGFPFVSSWPWLYSDPVFWDSSYYDPGCDSGYGYASSYQSAPNVTVVYGPPAQPVNPTVITLTAHPVMHEYRQPEDYGLPSEQASHPVLYLIAFNDHIIRAATIYWIENDKLRYLDTDHKQKEAPLSSVDRDFSAELNRERRVPFRLQ